MAPLSNDPEAALWAAPETLTPQLPDVLQVLAAIPLFEELGKAQLKKVARLLHSRTYAANEVVFREGDPGAGMFIIRRGEVRIVVSSPEGGQRVVTTLSDRQFFGEMALLDDAPRSASVVAAARTELLGFFAPDLETLMERDSDLGLKLSWSLAKLMAKRVRGMNESLKAQRPALAAVAAQ